MESPIGYLCVVLHGHLPFVRHPEKPECLEEDWFFEAMTEVYLPLVLAFRRLASEGIDFKIALSLSPPLTTMMTDPLLLSRYEHHLTHLIRLAEAECRRTADSPEFAPLARMYHQRFLCLQELWSQTLKRDLLSAFREFSQKGQVELITTAATHGFLPLMGVCPLALKTQVKVGIENFRRHFGQEPQGFWLPECGYTPGIDRILTEAGIRYTFLETHGILHADSAGPLGVYAPVRSPEGLVLFGRDPETAQQVWSALDGYPGDPWYRDFYRDIGFDLPEEILKPLLYHGGNRVSTGIKYFRITDRSGPKEPYDPSEAIRRVKVHAGNFLFNRERQVEHQRRILGQPPVVVAMYDAELFGHWWFEGPDWLEMVFCEFHSHRSVIQLATPSEILRKVSGFQVVKPHLSTWGWKGYNEVWLQGANAWMYRHLHRASWRMEELVRAYPDSEGITQRALTQALRELLLAQASDWAFILAQGTASGYASERFRQHIGWFTRLYEQLQAGSVDEDWLSSLERRDNLFDFLDYRVYR